MNWARSGVKPPPPVSLNGTASGVKNTPSRLRVPPPLMVKSARFSDHRARPWNGEQGRESVHRSAWVPPSGASLGAVHDGGEPPVIFAVPLSWYTIVRLTLSTPPVISRSPDRWYT